MLDGGAGLSGDTLIGGKGDDTYLIHSLNDTVIENPGEGNDTIVYVTSSTGSSSLSLASYANVENLTVTGAGTAVLTGNSGDNILTGNASANIFKGGDGNDTYIVGTGDLIVETASTGGNDTVISNASFGLSLYIENLTLTGTSAINGTGNTEDNIITGNSGANILNGGSGADSLIGGAGNDTYVIDNIGDTVTEAPGAGTDIIQSSITFDLVAHGVNVENLTLMASNGNIEGYGNTLANAITGNEGANILDGREGVDKLSGGLGDDTYIVDLIAVNGIAKLQDTVTELTNAGNDTLDLRAGDLGLLTATKLTLAASLENLDISLTGVNKINLTGNTLNNILTGNDWDNTISGGTGADTMNGGNGNDTLIVDNAGDSVSGGAGTDTILSSVNWDLTHSPDVENLTLTGTTALHGTGNGLANIITGTTGANLLDGGDGDDRLLGLAGSDTLLGGLGHDILDGGAGIDTLTGGGDSDTFVFHAAQATSAANADIITDFTAGPGGDALDIHDILVGYAGGPLGNFVHLTETNGNTIVSVDANGLTSGSAFVQIATLQGVTGLNADQMVTDVNLIVT
jgi:Ca2+-binding RTX toxin-like protein